MSQNSLTLPTTGTVSGLQMTQATNNALDTLNTLASGASAPASPEAGQFWHDTTNNILKLRSQDNTQWIALSNISEASYLAMPAFPSQITGSLNRIINGAMMIDQAQEGAAYSIPATNNFTYACDQWEVICNSATASGILAQRVSDAPAGFSNSLKVTVGTGAASVGSTDVLQISQPIEGLNISDFNYGSSSAIATSLSFWVKASIAGNYSILLSNSGGARTYVNKFTIPTPAVWQFVTFPNIPGDQTGTWNTSSSAFGISVSIIPAAGSGTQTSTLNAWQSGAFIASSLQNNGILLTSGATFQVTGVMFNPGSFCLPFEKRLYQQELQACERYYEKSFPAGTAVGQSAGVTGTFGFISPASSFGSSVMFRTPKRTSATITTFNPSAANANWRDTTSSADRTFSGGAGGDKGFFCYGSSGVANADNRIHYTANSRF